MNILKSIEWYLEHCKTDRNLSLKTIEAYRIDLLQLSDFMKSQRVTRLKKIDRTLIKSYYRSLGSYSTRSIKRKLAVAKGYLNFLEFERLIRANPFRSLRFRIEEPKELRQILSTKEVEHLLQHMHAEKEKVINKECALYKEKLRDLLIMEFLFATGIRVSELRMIRFTDISLSTGKILIRGKGKRERMVQICNQETLTLTHEYYFLNKPLIKSLNSFFVNKFGKPLSYGSVRHLFTKTMDQLSIRKKITPHTFRHTFATLLLEEGVDLKYIQHFLGHSTIRTTEMYTQVTGKKQHEILSTKHPRNSFELG